MKNIEDMTFNELVDHVTQQVHLGLLEGGGKEMKSRIYMGMDQAVRWHVAQVEREKQISTRRERMSRPPGSR